jgi:hypothetical protein
MAMHMKSSIQWLRALLGLMAGITTGLTAVLDLPRLREPAAIELSGDGGSNQLHVLEQSIDLQRWSEAAVLHHAAWRWVGARSPNADAAGYFRVRSRGLTGSDDGRNHLRLPLDPFTNEDPDVYSTAPAVRWVKFAITAGNAPRIWFQDSRRYAFHYDWARLRLAPFQGMSRAQFDAATLRRTNRLAILGAILIPPGAGTPEFGIQLVGQDEFTRDEVADVFERVVGAVQAPPGWRSFYVPAYEQAALAAREEAWFRGRGIDVTGADRWLSGDAVYSDGWAIGRLVQVPSAQIAAAYASGTLRPQDILLTDAVPAEVPYVAGILTLAPATPNSHVAILARTYGIPFAWSADPGLRSTLPGWSGREVAVRTDAFSGRLRVVDLTGQLTPELRAWLAVRKAVKPLQLVPKVRLGSYWTNTANLKPADVKWVGGKAANFGLLRRVLPTNSPVAIALTFDLWDDFMDQAMPGGLTLRQEIAARLGGVTWPPADIGAVTGRLAAVRDLIRKTARFNPAQRSAVSALLQQSGVPTDRKIRFRSSTNVEDTEQFTGAGLYDSYSGCLTDDLDGDTTGPSACDPGEPEERGVFRAIQRVYASFYNDNAFLERRRLGVDESIVGMAVLVHESFPDSDELANGVTTLNWNAGFGGSPSTDWRMVTQLGAESVTNPDSSARPEVVDGYRYGTSYSVALREGSSRVPLGASVLAWDSEYLAFGRLFNRVADAYSPLSGGKKAFALDFEFKKSVARGWQVKQVRPLPPPVSTISQVPVLFDSPVELRVSQGEFGDVFSNHRMKSRWLVSLKPTLLAVSNLQATLVREAAVTLLGQDPAVTWSNGPTGWPERGFRRTAEGTEDWLQTGAAGSRRRLILQTIIPTSVSGSVAPLLFGDDLQYRAVAQYGTPQVTLDWSGPTTTSEDVVHLVPTPTVTPASLPQERRMILANGAVQVVTRFYWPESPRGAIAGYTAPCIGWIGTTLTGLTTEPIELRSDAAQTYHPFHHNFAEEFLFEPALEPGLSPTQRGQLEARNIRILYVQLGHDDIPVRVVGLDGKLRTGL